MHHTPTRSTLSETVHLLPTGDATVTHDTLTQHFSTRILPETTQLTTNLSEIHVTNLTKPVTAQKGFYYCLRPQMHLSP